MRLKNQSDEIVSEEFVYLLDEKYYHNKKQFIFRNSLGCYDTFEFKGLSEQKNDYDFEEIHSIFREKINVTAEEIFKTNTGHLSNIFTDAKQAARYLSELFLSKEVYEQDD